MRIPRVYQASDLSAQQEIELDAAASQYLLKVLRLRDGARLEIFDGLGAAREAELICAGKRARATLGQPLVTQTESPLQLHIGLGISKGERMDYAIQKLVETGVSSITPLLTEYTVVKLDPKRAASRQQHWQGIIISACEQCGRNVLPQLHEVTAIGPWLDNAAADCKLAFDASATLNLQSIQPVPKSVCVLIGPEGGISEVELNYASKCNFRLARLGPRILRTETAAVAIAAALQTLWGDY